MIAKIVSILNTAKQNQKFPFHFFFRFAAEGWGEETRGKCKEIFWFLHTRVSERVRGALVRITAQSERTRQFQATTRSARAKWVRAKVSISPQIETSCSERTEVSRAEGAAEEWVGRKPRREATKSYGAETEKCRDLFLVLYLKTI